MVDKKLNEAIVWVEEILCAECPKCGEHITHLERRDEGGKIDCEYCGEYFIQGSPR